MNSRYAAIAAALLAVAPFRSIAFVRSALAPLPNWDRREATTPVSTEQQSAAEILRSRLPHARIDFDRVTGSPAMVSAPDEFLTGPAGQGKGVSQANRAAFAAGDPDGTAKAFLREHEKLFGYGPEALEHAAVKRQFTNDHNQLRTIVWQQQVDGVPVFEAILIAHTTRQGELVNLSSKFVRDAESAADRGLPNRNRNLLPVQIMPAEAVTRAARNIGEGAASETVSAASQSLSGPERKQNFQAPFLRGTAEAKLTWLPLRVDTLRLCWEVILTGRQRDEMFRVLVDANTGEVLLRNSLTAYISNITFNVFTNDSPSPFSPGFSFPSNAQPSLVSRTLVTLSALNTNASPNGWIDDGVNETIGNNVDAHTDRNADNLPDLPRPQGSPFRVFDFPLDLTTQDPTNYSQASVAQLFYLCNWMHDKLYELGFTEAAGNFQSNNFGRGGLGNDAVQADAQDGGGYNNANFSTPSDGSPGRMQMYLWTGPYLRRDGDLDAEVVFHEYTHGLSNRRVGGGVGLSMLQSQGMGEGWSDFYAMTLLSEPTDNVNACYACGGYCSYLLSAGFDQNYYFGIRRYPYSTDMTKNPLTFKDIDPAQASAHNGIPRSSIVGTTADEVHNMGEVWCVTLWEARANLINKLGYAIGNRLILQLVTDGMNLAPANPNYIQARDAILQADLVDDAGTNRMQLWAAFAKRGLGMSASSPSSSTTVGLVEAYDLPDSLFITPASLASAGPVGGPFTPNPLSLNLTNTGAGPLTWSLMNTCSWLTVAPTSGTLVPGGAGAALSVFVNSAATNFPLGAYNAAIWFTNLTSGVAQSRTLTLSLVGRSLFDNFDPGINLALWSSFGGVLGSTVIATNYGGYISPPNSLWFGDNGSRFATTIPVNTSSGGTISFYLALGNGSYPWETVDIPTEGIVLEYSTNSGASWTIAGTYDTSTYYSWTQVSLGIPPGAQSNATLFRWRQLSHSGNCCDHWALDNVSIDAGPTPPFIAMQPSNQSVMSNGVAIFSVNAAGTLPLSYQWQFNGFNLAQGTSSVLTISPVTTAQVGNYQVIVTNIYGAVTSSVATLTLLTNGGYVGYYTDNSLSLTGLALPILTAGFIPQYISNIATVNLSSLSMLAINEEDNSIISSQLLGRLPDIEAWVRAGGRVIIHDRSTGNLTPNPLLIGATTSNCVRYTTSDIDVVLPDTLVTAGPFGVISNTTLDGGSSSAHGFVFTNNLPPAARAIISMGGAPNEAVSFSYPLGGGYVYYSSIPLDCYLLGGGCGSSPISLPLQNIYTPNVMVYVSSLSQAPLILAQPADQLVRTGATACVSVAATGTTPLFYQWRKDAVLVPGASNSWLCISNTVVGDSGAYDVIISNVFGVVTSAVANVTVYIPTPPIIMLQPTNQTIVAGTVASVVVGATGDIPLTYQWLFFGTNLPGATSSALTFVPVQGANAGDYQALVTNWLGSATSQVATVSVVFAPTITLSPQSQTVPVGTNVLFTVIADGTPPLSYQWRHGGTNLPSATTTSLALPAVTYNDSGAYDVLVTNTYGTAASAAALLTVVSPPVISQQPQGQTVPAGTNVAFSVTASGSGILFYQWRFNGTDIPGATGTSLTISDVQASNAGPYAVFITNFVGSLTSQVAVLEVPPTLPLFTLQPCSQGVFPGFNSSFAAAVTGTEPFTYQWQLNGADVSNATNTSLTVSNVQITTAGLYHVIASNAVGQTTSADALLALAPVASWGWNNSGQNNLPVDVTNAVAISAGAAHNVAILANGRVIAWGAVDQTNVPPDLTNAVSVAAGGGHSLALRNNGLVVAWGGSNAFGQTNVPPNLSNVVAIAAGGNHSLALKSDGTVLAWGNSYYGQTLVPTALTNVIAIAAGSNHSLALQANGKVIGWGSSIYGESLVPTNLNDVVAIAAGGSHSLALRSDGTVLAWGWNFYGQSSVPPGLSNIVAIAAGGLHSLAQKADGTLVAWGAGSIPNVYFYPHLGQSIIPPSVTNVTAVCGGLAHTLAFAGGGSPFIHQPPVGRVAFSGRRVVFRAAATGAFPLSYQWQLNGTNIPAGTNQLLIINNAFADSAGNYQVVVTNNSGSVTSSVATLRLVDAAPFVVAQPVGGTVYLGSPVSFGVTVDGSGPFTYQWRLNGTNIAGATNSNLVLGRILQNQAGGVSVVVSNAFGGISSTKANLTVLQVLAWGAGTNYLGSPNYGQSVVPAGLNGVLALAGGGYHTLAVKSNGQVVAWGAGTNYLSSPNYGQSMVPAAALTNVVAVAAGLYHSLALKVDGTVLAWGAGTSNYYTPNYGQSMVPAGLGNVIAIAAGDYHSVALKSDGRVVVWGYNLYSVTNVPAAATNIVAIASRGSHILALRADGALVHWGSQYSLPYGVSNIVAIAAGVNHCLALKSDGTVVSWGSQYIVPATLSNAVDIAAGYDYSLALKSDGRVAVWGTTTNGYGLGAYPTNLTSGIAIGCGMYHSLAALGDGSVLIRRPPVNTAAYLGSQAFFKVMALGTQPLSYQWQLNGVDIQGATNVSLTLANLQTGDAGNYRVVVSNLYSSATSAVASLTVLLPLGEALDNQSLLWSASGNAAWFGQTNAVHYGLGSAQSGFITDNQQSSLQTYVNGAGTLNFWWKVSSEEWFDYLNFYIDGIKQAGISGEVDWQQQTYAIADGLHTLRWTYAKDPSVSVGADAGWLDQVSFVTNPPVIVTQPLSQTVPMGNPAMLYLTVSGAPPLSYQWIKDGTNLNGATGAYYNILQATRRDTGQYSVLVSNPGGAILSSNALIFVPVPQRLGAPVILPDGTITITSGDADGGLLQPGDLANFEAQTSSNLVDWVTLPNGLTVTNGFLLLVDPHSTDQPARFYRILEH